MTSTFDKLYAVDVSAKTEKKNGLTYLSWASAWAEAKKICPSIQYTIYKEVVDVNSHGEPVTRNYFHDGKSAWVEVGVTVDNLEYIEHLPIMDFRHKSIPLEKVTSWDVIATIKRCLTKALAMHGLGLRIYEGDDLAIKEVETTFKLPANGTDKKTKAPLSPKSKTWPTAVKWIKEQLEDGKTIEDIIKTLEKTKSITKKTKEEIYKLQD